MDSSRFLLDADANLVPFFFLQEALLGESCLQVGEMLCVWLSQKSSQIPASTTSLCDWHYVTSAFEIFPYFDQKSPN